MIPVIQFLYKEVRIRKVTVNGLFYREKKGILKAYKVAQYDNKYPR